MVESYCVKIVHAELQFSECYFILATISSGIFSEWRHLIGICFIPLCPQIKELTSINKKQGHLPHPIYLTIHQSVFWGSFGLLSQLRRDTMSSLNLGRRCTCLPRKTPLGYIFWAPPAFSPKLGLRPSPARWGLSCQGFQQVAGSLSDFATNDPLSKEIWRIYL